MRRRDFIGGLGGAAAWPLGARAQQSDRVRRLGVLMNGVATETEGRSYLVAFMQGLRQLGWTEGQNLRIDVRWMAGDAGLARTYATQLSGLMPDVILAASTTNLTMIRQATSTVPVVFVLVSDPVAQGFVTSMRQSDTNVTGFGGYEFSVGGKWLDLLKKVAPGLARIAVMFNPDTSPQSKFFMPAIEVAALSLGVQANVAPVRTTADIDPALASLAREANGGLILPTDEFTRLHYPLITDLATRYRLPSIAATYNFAKAGGLMEYGADFVSQFRQAASYVDRILKGSKPSELPVQAPTSYRFVINLKTARAMGLEVSRDMLSIADEVIE